MALNPTSKIRLFVSTAEEKDVLSFLQSQSVMEITQIKDEIKDCKDHTSEFALSELDFVIKYLSQFEEKKEGLRNSVLGEKIEISELEKERILKEAKWEGVSERLSQLEASKTDADRKLLELEGQRKSLLLFRDCDVKKISSRFSVLYFSLPKRLEIKVENKIKEISPLLELQKVNELDEQIAYLLFAEESVLSEVKDIFVKESV